MSPFRDPLPLAQALIRRASVTPADEGALDVLEQTLTALGFHCARLTFGAEAGRPPIANLYARRGRTGPNICFAGHTDVVPPGQGWSVPPFEAQVVGDHLYGRGAADMKGAIACFVAAVARLPASETSAGSISLLITGDEEGRALDGTQRVLDWLAERGETLDLCLVGEPTNPRHLGEMIKIGRRGSLNGRLRVLGSQGHVAYPHLADNPLPRLLSMLAAITARPLDEGSAHFQPSTLALTSIDVGNEATNVIPAEGRAAFNIRFNDLHTGAGLERWLRERFDEVGGAYELSVEVSGESFLTPPGRLSDAVSKAIAEVTGHTPELSTTGGTSDARFIKNACPVVEFGLVGQTMHKADERVPLADLEALTRIYLSVLRACLTIPC
ncbi:succinyl-diaminopimelate desuccinylase [Telmatospirillum siberiense]|uniref:Succinyl-diaminopimelate desuccinylase n=1 Tax=Telmatospirillum siberiense TaxID=382514 RepID=A0A2N3Q0M2_9PROT|nr:succinyl-diaminopimelate desuccinylase [Telmatospirillum siberiense]PKU26205.1 succinyl-diaminopimelate desuccinylase [Telmatospirillum siberiense]